MPDDRFERWQQQVEIYYVDENSPWVRLTGSATSNIRCLEVQIRQSTADGQWKTLATAKRLFAYVPPLP